MRLSAKLVAHARAVLARIDGGVLAIDCPEARHAERDAAIRLLRRYGRSRTGLMGARPPQWRPDDGFKPSGWARTSWEDRLNFCLDVESVIFGLKSPRERVVLMQCFALDRDRVAVARELNVCTRTLNRLQDVALDHFVVACKVRSVPM